MRTPGFLHYLRKIVGDVLQAAGGNTTVRRASSCFAFTNTISPAQITVSQNDYNPTGLSTAGWLRLNSSGTVNITGLVPTSGLDDTDGRVVFIHNVGAQSIVLKDDDGATSTAANRFALPSDITLSPDSVVVLQYDNTTQRWRCVGGGGGGGGAPSTSQYLTLATDAGLANERVLVAGGGLTGTDGGAGGNFTLAVGAGTGITVNADDVAVNFVTQTDQESASSNVLAVTPGRQHFHPGSLKVWTKWGITTTIDASYNTSSITDNAIGDWTVNFTTAFSSVNYAFGYQKLGTCFNDIGNAQNTGSCRVQNNDDAGGGPFDPTKNYFMAAGDQ